MNNVIECPCCKGTGFIDNIKKNNKNKINPIRDRVVLLRKQGYSIRKICKLLGYNSSSSVFYYIKKEVKNDNI